MLTIREKLPKSGSGIKEVTRRGERGLTVIEQATRRKLNRFKPAKLICIDFREYDSTD